MSQEARSVCVFSESADVALELLVPAQQLAADLGSRVVSIALDDHDASESLAHGADRVVIFEGRSSGGLEPAGGAELLCEAVGREQPLVVLMGATADGTEIAARAAQRLGVGCAAECLSVAMQDGEVIIERAWLGGFVARQVISTRPVILTVRPGRYEIPCRTSEPSLEKISLPVAAPEPRTRVLSTRQRERSGVRLDRADIIVAIGRGLKSEADLTLIGELAGALDGAVGATRPLTDDFSWLAVDLKIGLSGQTVCPKLYIACGISGQIEHVVGMRESRMVVAINRDPLAPIMEQADYRVVGDLYEIVPALTRTLKEVAESGAKAVRDTLHF